MTAGPVFTSRLSGRQILDSEDVAFGRIRDVVILPTAGGEPPLLAQNRQDDRDRASIERDRELAARTQADTEFLARELAAVRLALADVVTTRT
jgi:hypothetical protein